MNIKEIIAVVIVSTGMVAYRNLPEFWNIAGLVLTWIGIHLLLASRTIFVNAVDVDLRMSPRKKK